MLADGTVVVTYEYDAWGNIIDHSFVSSHAGVYIMNAYTYRGYQYDRGTGLYYLQSRYYDPEVGRFLNADDTSYFGASGTTLGYNLYTYCENNTVAFCDYTGNVKIAILYDNRSSGILGAKWLGGKGFKTQAKHWINGLTDLGHTVNSYGFNSIYGFCGQWNSLFGTYNTIIIIAHGDKGSLDCSGERLLVDQLNDSKFTVYRSSRLKKFTTKFVYVFSCNGGSTKKISKNKTSQSIAHMFAYKTGAKVFAVSNGKLNIDYYTGKVSKFGGDWISVQYANGTYSIEQYKFSCFTPYSLF